MLHIKHSATHDPRNKEIQMYINRNFHKREDAKILVFDSVYLVEYGIWPKFWYANVSKSSEFSTYKAKVEQFPKVLEPLLNQCLSCYEKLQKKALG